MGTLVQEQEVFGTHRTLPRGLEVLELDCRPHAGVGSIHEQVDLLP
ncbi:MAG TPA: hypothetical protein VFE45_05610 [Coriobacteriia bacterium]|nr:hypothetical protein [Coriobacteriia bacterium]